MADLFIRTLSQGLQAFVPVACYFLWIRLSGHADLTMAFRSGLAAAVPATVGGTRLLQTTNRQALWECALATATTALAVWFAITVWRRRRAMPSGGARTIRAVGVAAAVALVIVRQTAEIGVVFAAAAFQLRAVPATLVVCSAALLAFVISRLCVSAGQRSSPTALKNAVRTFSIVFLLQAAMYAFHESAEARLLPFSEVLHAATEPYGPDSHFGYYVSWLLVGLPAAAIALTLLREHLVEKFRTAAVATALALTCIVIFAVNRASTSGALEALGAPLDTPAAPTVASLARGPHVLFRHTRIDRAYGALGIAPLLSPDAARATSDVQCERVSFAGDRGICLQADRGVHTTFRAVLVDRMLTPGRVIPLDGAPSRTRVSADGRFGAMTVFVTGADHAYAGSKFSTKTTLIDMKSGELLGDLEQFTTWRLGAPFLAKDFNFWGVTFTRDSNIFYATLQTAGAAYLVRGDVALRKLTVIHDNVECPAVSPDDRLIAYKRRVSPMPSAWRLHILDLATMTDRPLAGEERYVDDQVEWLDDHHVLYAIPHAATADIWVAPVDGTSPPFVFMHDAQSPIVVR